MPLSKEKIEYFKKKLEKKKEEIEKALGDVSRENPAVPGDWETTPADMNTMVSDKNELADTFEQLENRAAIGDSLEEQLVKISGALERIKKGTYGTCEEGGEEIEEKRLEVFPMARRCIKHAKEHTQE